MGQPSIVLQDIVILRPRRPDQFLHHRLDPDWRQLLRSQPQRNQALLLGEMSSYQDLLERLIGYVCEFRAVVFGYHELFQGGLY